MRKEIGKMPDSIDAIDRRLLNLLQQNNRLSADAMAEKIGSSRSSVQRRMGRLRDEGYIDKDISVLSSKLYDERITAIITLNLVSVRADLRNNFQEMMKSLDEVQQCYFVTGTVDFILVISLKNMREYEIFTREKFAENPNVQRYHANIVANRIKVGLNVEL
jgi:Lrp/AsnC family leucine-responsive transcriptional regulator